MTRQFFFCVIQEHVIQKNRVQIIQLMKRDQQEYGESIYQSACNTAIDLYHFLEARYKYTDTTQWDFMDKVIQYIINGDPWLFNDIEFEAINLYLQDISTDVDYDTICLYEKIVQEEYNAQGQSFKKIEEEKTKIEEEKTMNCRNLLEYASFLLDDETLNYIKYNWNIHRDTDDLLFFNEMYYLGYIAGKRAERKKRKKASKD